MNIGIDFDGVVFDFERNLVIEAEVFDYELQQKGLQNGIRDKKKFKFQEKYNWDNESKQLFINNYLDKINTYSDLVPGSKWILKKLKEENYNLIIISARGEHTPNEIKYADKIIEKYKLKFDEINWNITDKAKMCKEKCIDIFIDDRYENCRAVAEVGIKTIYFNELSYTEVEDTENLVVVNNWGQAYRKIKDWGEK